MHRCATFHAADLPPAVGVWTVRSALLGVVAGSRPRGLVLLAGGKSGGHVFPALAVAQELAELGYRLAWVGTVGGMEERLARDRGLEFHGLPSAPFVGRRWLARARALLVLLVSALRAWALVRRLDVATVIGTGGFVSAPAVIGAWLARRPVLLLEPNAEAGVANRLLSRLATAAAIAHRETGSQLRCPVVVTGVPVRSEIFAAEGERASDAVVRLLVLGGSQGSQNVNRAVASALPTLPEQPVTVLHQSGAHDFEEMAGLYRRSFGSEVEPYRYRHGAVEVRLVPFVDDVAAALRQADLVVSRAGAVTLAEICAAGRAALLVPLTLAGGHQQHNALVMEQHGAATVVAEQETDRLRQQLVELLADRQRLREMGRAARQLASPEASRLIAARIEEMAEARRR